MKRFAFLLTLLFVLVGCGKRSTPKLSTGAAPATAASAPASGPFTNRELQEFAALDPVDTHTHVFQSNPAFYALLKKLNLHILDIMLVTDTDAELENLSKESADTWRVVH